MANISLTLLNHEIKFWADIKDKINISFGKWMSSRYLWNDKEIEESTNMDETINLILKKYIN